ncbi:MAG: hypothetical protein JO212_12060 [Acetobacteraceae bacterium]|nr:hypothetical protein [Acetobacteraceae bacterium]
MRLLRPTLPAWLGFIGVLQACAPTPPPRVPSRVFAIDFVGAAKSCTVPKVSLVPGQARDVAISVGNDGGWCAVTVAQPGPSPYDVGLLVTRPGHGKVYVHTVGDETRIDYTPDPGYTGADHFAVRFEPGEPVLRATVNVTPAAGPIPASAPR